MCGEYLSVTGKATNRLREDHFRGLRAIDGLSGLKRRILLYLGESAQRTKDGIEIWPFRTFADNLAAGKF